MTQQEHMEIDLDDDTFLDEEPEQPPPAYTSLVQGFKHGGGVKAKKTAKIVRIPRPRYDYETAKSLSNIVIQGKRGIRYHPNLTTVQGGRDYIVSRGLDPEKWTVDSGDWDNDPNTPDNVIIYQDSKPRVIDGYTLSSRRPDFLYRAPKWKGEFDEIRKITDDNERKVKTPQLKHYLLTHSTQASQASENVAKFIDRDNKNKYKDIIHKMYLEHTHRNKLERTDQLQKDFVALVENDISKESPKLPSTMLRDHINSQIKTIEEVHKLLAVS
jgi:hypothetical protein